MNPDFSSGAFLSINKTQLSALPPAHFKGEIRVVDHEQGIIEAIAELRKSNMIGFDTETRPSFRKGQINSVALVQLSTRSVCFLFRINITGLSQHIIDLLEDENILKIGLSVHDDFHNLNKITHISPKGFIDLQNYVKEYEIADNSLSRIYGIVFGELVSKGQRLTNWEAEYLTPSQQCYAALDAMACIQIYDYLSEGHFHPEESPYIVYHSEEKDIETPADNNATSPENSGEPDKSNELNNSNEHHKE